LAIIGGQIALQKGQSLLSVELIWFL